MTTALACLERCFICCGYGYVIIWRHYPAPCITTTNVGWSLSNTYSNGPSMFGTPVRCPACWARTTERLAWLRASKIRQLDVAP